MSLDGLQGSLCGISLAGLVGTRTKRWQWAQWPMRMAIEINRILFISKEFHEASTVPLV